MKISLLLPYYERQEAANKALESLKQYHGLDLEIIVVDDGSRVPFAAPEGMAVKVITLPQKNEPKSPVFPWNVAAKAATGDVLVLSCIEVIHDRPILEELTRNVGPDDYIAAAAWCPEENNWHTHSTVSVPDCPEGSGIAFCAALRPELFWRVGGFDEDYREGAGYEDRDFLRRLGVHGAKFHIRDELVVTHPKTGATTIWGQKKFDHNYALYRLKWPETPPVTFVCLNAGNYCGRGAEYVNNLADMVKRNMPNGVVWKFVCLTDDATGLDDGIEVIPLPADLETWWGKLYLFKPGLFQEGSRMVFFDLDTLIVDSLAKILQYRGDMAILRDFYQPNRGAPGVILWRAGFGSQIWNEWEAEGRPRNPMGDLGWIEGLDQGRFTRQIDRLQDLFPGVFVSYKVTKGAAPIKAGVVCFHGHPRPHEVVTGWVPAVWKVGGVTRSELVVVCNTENEKVLGQIESACSRDLDWLDRIPDHDGHVCIVGGGPWLQDGLNEIRVMQSFGHKVWALNNTHDWLIERGIVPDACILLDAREGNAEFVRNARDDVTYYVASQCHPDVFEALHGKRVVVYHNATEGAYELLSRISKRHETHLLGGGGTVGMKALVLARFLGFKFFHLYGMDSCYREGDGHAYQQNLNSGEKIMDVICENRAFKCAPWMISQANDFQEMANLLLEQDCVITVSGDGLLAYIARMMCSQTQDMIQPKEAISA